ncbi:MAG: translation initiation factor IF-2 subunit gamma [Halobacteria archaeon]|nr:translation initiation factor IF-2 subunit gamma [Halobacteria archaeon]
MKQLQPEVNIGLVGHVDHGKTTLVQALSGKWTDEHSEEMERGISIRLGYADATFRNCPDLDPPESYTVEETCPDGSESEVLREVSFVDSPGHETLMATMLAGASLMDGAVLVISANDECPQPQTKEHLMALDIIGIENIVIAQNKIDLVSRDEAVESHDEIKEFVEGTVAEDAPIVPVSAEQNVNIDLLIEAIQEEIPTPDRNPDAPPHMLVARSFDVNRPGTPPDSLRGGVIGGSLASGVFEEGDEIEVRPGVERDGDWQPIQTEIRSLMAGEEPVEKVTPGGLIGVGTGLDPSLTKGDSLAGQIAGDPDELPPVVDEFTMEVDLLDRVVGMDEGKKVEPINTGEPLMISVGTATTVGTVTSARGDEAEVKLKRPVCARQGSRMAINRRMGTRWRLIGVGVLK